MSQDGKHCRIGMSEEPGSHMDIGSFLCLELGSEERHAAVL